MCFESPTVSAARAASSPSDDRFLPPRVNRPAGDSAAPRQLPGTPEVGQIVAVRSRRWLVEEVLDPDFPVVRLACADDDAQGQTLEVFWDCEPDRRILEEEGWEDLARRFDSPRLFAAFLNTMRWNCVTATDPRLFQSPFRAGIRLHAYQMEPLRKALRLPRVNLFIADDTGIGKTIEAGLIARELLLRRKVKTIVIAAPRSVLEQWQSEMEDRFGLVFEILDRSYVARMRRERGFSVNPWRTHSRFLISHSLLRDPTYSEPMRQWLTETDGHTGALPGSLLILDEAHHAAPASRNRYAIESQFTRAVRELAWCFEHRLFLSATPHNGHSNSFSTLLEILDPTRFTRGVKVRGKKDLEPVMVRRLKEDIRRIGGGFPERKVIPIEVTGLPDDAPELVLSRLLDEYREVRDRRFAEAPRRRRAHAELLVIGLQQRLLSSIEAFARSLARHRETLDRQRQRHRLPNLRGEGAPDGPSRLFVKPADADDERGGLSVEENEAEEESEIARLNAGAEAGHRATETAMQRTEDDLLDRMTEIADRARHHPDAKSLYLLDWIRKRLCPGLPPFGEAAGSTRPTWEARRVLIFTENRVGTVKYLRDILGQAIAGTEQAEERIEVITGQLGGASRREIQRRFNTHPDRDPLRILIATDAAREGLNFQAHCSDLFHFDLPWNPARIEQRNGRIDRQLQPEPEVRCHYFLLPQRAEDHVLRVLVDKTERIRRELGGLSRVLTDTTERALEKGIRHRATDRIRQQLLAPDPAPRLERARREELENLRERERDLEDQVAGCQSLLQRSRDWVGFGVAPFREALSSALELLRADPLIETRDGRGRRVWKFPPLDRRATTDASWASTLDGLRRPRRRGEKLADWRNEAPIRPVVFEDTDEMGEDTVHFHLEQRVAQRLLARFRAQGFVYHDLARACLSQAKDSIPRVVLLGRLCLYGDGAERLHEALVPVAARWIPPSRRKEPLKPYAASTRASTLDLLWRTLHDGGGSAVSESNQRRLLDAAPRDIADLRPRLEEQASELAVAAGESLRSRGNTESKQLETIIGEQRQRVRDSLEKHRSEGAQLSLFFADEEKRQYEADVREWKRRLERFDAEIRHEPARVRGFYEVRARRIEPVGLVYLWPDTN